MSNHTWRVNLWDVDGCMVRHQFPNGKQNDDITMDKPFPWVKREVMNADINIMVSGRGSGLKDITEKWWDNNCRDVYGIPCGHMSYVGVDWNHRDTSDQRLDAYVKRKVAALIDLIERWRDTMVASNMDCDIHVYEDDENVLREVKKHEYYKYTDEGLHVVDAAGEVHDYP